jgi:hypothetical protein
MCPWLMGHAKQPAVTAIPAQYTIIVAEQSRRANALMVVG